MTTERLLTGKQEDYLVMQLAEGQTTFTEKDLEIVTGWAEKTVINSTLFELVQQGKILLSVKNGEPHFKNASC